MPVAEHPGGHPCAVGVLCALPRELGGFSERVARRRSVQGLDVGELEVGGRRVLTAVAGIGKVRAARAAAILIGEGAARLAVVGTCGGLRRSLRPGTMVHCRTAFQADFAVRDGRSFDSEPTWRAAWREHCPGPEGWFLTADRPVLSPWRRIRLARAFAGPCVADMETAAAASVADAAAVPWAALRIVTDRAGLAGSASFARNYPTFAPQPADSLMELLPDIP